jgi:hypothetical protein
LLAGGYDVAAQVDQRAMNEARRFVDEWIERMDPFYLAAAG